MLAGMARTTSITSACRLCAQQYADLTFNCEAVHDAYIRDLHQYLVQTLRHARDGSKIVYGKATSSPLGVPEDW